MTERENMQLVWEHKQPEWVPMINTAAQMLIVPEINDRPLRYTEIRLIQTGKKLT